jgi:type I restriction enzyme, S subunit
MIKEKKLTTLDYCCRITDGTHDTPKPSNEGYYLVTSKNILNGDLNLKDAYKISENDYIEVNKRSRVEQWDILFSMIGSVGQVYIERNLNPEYAIKNLGLFKMGGDKNKAIKLYYFLKSSYFQKKLQFWLSGSIQSFVPLYFLREIELPNLHLIPNELIDQIETVQEKISVNTKVISKMEEYSQLLFHKWFINFNFPDESGRPYKDNGGTMEHKGGKLLPVGWDLVELPKVCSIVDCLHSKKPDRVDEENGNILLQLNNIKEFGLIDTTEKYFVSDEDYSLWTSRIEVTGGDLVITNAGRVGAIAQIPEGFEFGIGRNMTAIRPEKVFPTFLYLFFNSSDLKTQIKKKTDQGSFFGSLNVRGIKQLTIIKPDEKNMTLFEEKARIIRRKIELINVENQYLFDLRDLLISKLFK